MKQKYLFGLTGLSVIVAVVVALVGLFNVQAADHKDSPLTAEDPAADLTDIYAFRSPAHNDNLVAVMNVNPLSLPGSLSYAFAPDVLYQLHVNNTSGLTDNAVVTVTFEPATLGHPQTFTVGGLGAPIVGTTTAPTDAKTPNAPTVVTRGPITIFAGPRDDPFFFDLVGFVRYLGGPITPAKGLRPAGETPMDTFAGTNVSAIVLELPITAVTGAATSNTGTIRVWASTARIPKMANPNFLNQWNWWQAARSASKLDPNDWAAFRAHERAIGAPDPGASMPTMRQVDRMGIPAINTALIPSAMKDAFNRGTPANDARDYRATAQATIMALRAAVKPVLPAEDNPGVPADVLASVLIPDVVTIDFSKPVAFPNGRRLQDDVIDAALGLVLNRGNVLGGGPGMSDGVNANDVAFLTSFPYLAAPHQPQ